jgi:hypothetical protein
MAESLYDSILTLSQHSSQEHPDILVKRRRAEIDGYIQCDVNKDEDIQTKNVSFKTVCPFSHG